MSWACCAAAWSAHRRGSHGDRAGCDHRRECRPGEQHHDQYAHLESSIVGTRPSVVDAAARLTGVARVLTSSSALAHLPVDAGDAPRGQTGGTTGTHDKAETRSLSRATKRIHAPAWAQP